jgi:glycosyltransferase involved in cell wall biosynthesis
MMMPMKATIVINNYNYGRFVASAIDSALAQDWPHKEIIVVDDGSTDDSRAIISSYGTKVLSFFKENGGQTSAVNLALRHATGDPIFILDSDDILLPNALTTVISAWYHGISKMQFPMITIREDGSDAGSIYPNFSAKQTPERVRHSIALVSFYWSSPTSGNAWSRDFLKEVFPLPEDMRFFDGYLSALTAFFGDVVTLTTPLAKYRINTSNFWTKNFSPKLIADTADEQAAITAKANRFLADKFGTPPLDHRRDFAYMMKQIVVKKFLPAQCNDTWPTVFRLSCRSIVKNPNFSAKTKLLLAAWFLSVFATPKPIAIRIVKLRFVPSYRPPIITKLLKFSGWRG